MNKTQRRVITVLGRLEKMAHNADDAKLLSESLEEWLDTLRCEDFFGTEGQNDPRGDFIDGEWSMSRVQDIDGNQNKY